jgi:hypothetical protein
MIDAMIRLERAFKKYIQELIYPTFRSKISVFSIFESSNYFLFSFYLDDSLPVLTPQLISVIMALLLAYLTKVVFQI